MSSLVFEFVDGSQEVVWPNSPRHRELLADGHAPVGSVPESDGVSDALEAYLDGRPVADEALPERLSAASLSATIEAAAARLTRVQRTKTGILLDAMTDAGLYAANNGGTAAATGSATDGMAMTTSGASTYTQVSADLTADLSRGFLSWEMKADANFSRVTVAVGVASTDFSKRFERQVKVASETVAGEWRRVSLPLAIATATGATAANLADVRNIRFEVHSTSGGATTMNVRDLRWHPYPYPDGGKAGILMLFDDGLKAHYSEAFRVMEPLGLIGSCAVIPESVGGANWMTLAQLQEMQSAGWEHVGHGTNGLSGQADWQQRNILRAAREYLTANGMPEGRGMFIYPGGTWDTNTMRYMKRLMGAGRIAGGLNPENPMVSDLNLLKPYYITKATPLSTYTADVDKLAERGGLLIMTFHNIVPTTSATEDISIANFEALCAHIAASGVPTYKPSEVYDLSAQWTV